MTARRKVAVLAALGAGPVLLTGLTAGAASAHGSMQNPVSRVAACFAENPESPDSAACKAAVAASGTQAFYDWNEVNIPNAAGGHKQIIPDGKLCSANRDKYKGLDLPRTDWPATKVSAGTLTFKYKATAPHRGTFDLYITRKGYNPAKPLKWSDLESRPFASATNPRLENGAYVFTGRIPARTGRHLIYAIWQRSDSPEAFYSCSDVTFGGSASVPTGTKSTRIPAAPSDGQIAAGAQKSTVDHAGHGGDGHGTKQPPASPASAPVPASVSAPDSGNGPAAKHASGTPLSGRNLAETGGDGSTLPLALGGAAVIAFGAGALVLTRRRSSARNRA